MSCETPTSVAGVHSYLQLLVQEMSTTDSIAPVSKLSSSQNFQKKAVANILSESSRIDGKQPESISLCATAKAT